MYVILGEQTAGGQRCNQAEGSDKTADDQQPNFHVVDFVKCSTWYATL